VGIEVGRRFKGNEEIQFFIGGISETEGKKDLAGEIA